MNIEINLFLNYPLGGLPEEVNTIMKRQTDKIREYAFDSKEDGNREFRDKKYRRAIHAYNSGLEIPINDPLLTAQLLTNRAVAHFYLGNFRGSLNDCKEALESKKDHFKALKRGAMCLQKLGKNEECVEWAQRALKIDGTDAEVMEILRIAKEE